MRRHFYILASAWVFPSLNPAAAVTNLPPLETPLPDVGFSVIRVLGALAIVLALFLGGVWLVKNWRRFALNSSPSAKLHILEMRALGHRHALYVVGYEQQRMLLAASPTGVSFIAQLPEAENALAAPPAVPPSFTLALRHILQRKS